MLGLELVMTGLLHLAAGEITCPKRSLPTVKVSPSKSSIKYDHSKSQDELNGFQIDTINPYGTNKKTHVGGLMSGEIQVAHQIGFVQEKYETANRGCLHYDTIRVTIHIDPTIYIATENQKGTCRYNAILEHEKQHVQVDRMIVNKYAKRIGNALSFALNKYGASFGPFALSAMEGTQARLQGYIDDIVNKEVERMNAERKELQQQLDSLDEYERVAKACK